ncbi:MAG: hypothetical protein D6729_07925 [Deltaproteobacteria bacterium]|nr:MAG: hypothetical protein D6729_07925 [Deltaproteobacteria bacterium]
MVRTSPTSRLALLLGLLCSLALAGATGCPDPARQPKQQGAPGVSTGAGAPGTQTAQGAPEGAGAAGVGEEVPGTPRKLFPSEPDPGDVLARFAGRELTARELDATIAGELASQEQEFAQKRFELRRQALERYVSEQLLEAEAKKRGLPDSEALVRSEVDTVDKKVTEEEIQAFYEANKQAIGGMPLEYVRDRIEQAVVRQRQQKKFDALMERLRAEAKVEILFDAPRVEVEATGPALGPKDAPVTIVEFSDFECPYCGRAKETVHQIVDAYPKQVRFVFRNFPLSFHSHARKAAEAGLCAAAQGKFWPYHDILFGNQQALEVEDLKAHAAKVKGLDVEAFSRCLDSGEMAEAVERDIAAGQRAGVTGTPAFFVNGIPVSGAMPFERFKKLIDDELARAAKGGGPEEEK